MGEVFGRYWTYDFGDMETGADVHVGRIKSQLSTRSEHSMAFSLHGRKARLIGLSAGDM